MLFRRTNVEKKEINHAYEEFEEDYDIIFLCADEQRQFDDNHPVDAQCFPLRSIDKYAKTQLDPDATYYVYALNEGTAYEATKKLLRHGFKAYDVGSNVNFKGPEEGLEVKKKRRRRR